MVRVSECCGCLKNIGIRSAKIISAMPVTLPGIQATLPPKHNRSFFLNDHYTYLLILAASFAGPFLLSFDKKVAFYKKWKYVLPATILPALFYILWDIYFTDKGVWHFSEAH